MIPNTRPYRNQHAELARLAAAIPLDPRGLQAREASNAVACLRSVLIVHVKMQDGLLYPWMMRHPLQAVRNRAAQMRPTMSALLVTFLEFAQRWGCASAIECDAAGFLGDVRPLLTLLRQRLRAEEDELYAMLDRIVRDCDVALAS